MAEIIRMNMKMMELAKVLIFEGIHWLGSYCSDKVLQVNDYFHEEGIEFTLEEIEFVERWLVKRVGGY
jgi:hypothetical protein